MFTNTENTTFEFATFYPSNYFEEEFSYKFHFNNDIDVKNHMVSLTEIKSTEEVSQRNYSSMSLMAEENDPICDDFIAPISEATACSASDLNKLVSEIRGKIYSDKIEDVVAEALDFQFCTEGDDARPIQQKRKKSDEQIQALEDALKANKNWSKEFTKELAAGLNLKFRQVYKWYWDKTQKKAKRESNKRVNK